QNPLCLFASVDGHLCEMRWCCFLLALCTLYASAGMQPPVNWSVHAIQAALHVPAKQKPLRTNNSGLMGHFRCLAPPSWSDGCVGCCPKVSARSSFPLFLSLCFSSAVRPHLRIVPYFCYGTICFVSLLPCCCHAVMVTILFWSRGLSTG